MCVQRDAVYVCAVASGREVCRVGFQPSPRAAGNLRHATAPPHMSECLSLEGGGLGVVLRLQRMTD